MLSCFRSLLVCALLPCLIGSYSAALGAEWKDAKGVAFSGAPSEVLGPQLLFRDGPFTTKTVPMRVFTPEDCVRFYQGVADQPARAARWSEATGELSRELLGRVQYYIQEPARRVDFAAVPEPELFVVVFWGDWALNVVVDDLVPFLDRVERVYPGRLRSVVVRYLLTERGVAPRHPTKTGSFYRGWLATAPRELSGLPLLARFVDQGVAGEYSIFLLTRRGIPLLGGPLRGQADIMAFVDGASDLLWKLNPANPRSARDRLHYLRAVRPVQFARARAEPLLLIDPFNVEILRARDIRRIEAEIEIGADGAVGGVTLAPESEIPPALVALVTDTLRRNAIYLPAIDQGRAVAAKVRYSLKVEPMSPQFAADAAWVKGEARVDMPIKDWLVLKPIRVPQHVFTMIDRVEKDGTVLLKPVTAGRADKTPDSAAITAFDRDWFAGAGAGSVRPVAGAQQEVDGDSYTWKTMTATAGFVNLIEDGSYRRFDHCIAYAWTEVDSPEDIDGWLGFGSDDGAKVWFNGTLVDDKWTTRRSRLDDDVVPVRLKKGKNQILVKVQNYTIDWTFTLRLRTRIK